MVKIGRTKKRVCYHDRCGHPVAHETGIGRKFIMVRAPKGEGVKRLYEGSKHWSHTDADGKRVWTKLEL